MLIDICGLPVGEVLHKLEDEDSRQSSGRTGGAPAMGIEIGKVLIGKERAKRIAEGQIPVPAWKGSVDNLDGHPRDRVGRTRRERHDRGG